MTVDAHHHVWRLSRGDYGWLTPALGPICRDFEADDLAPILARHGIARTILVQAAPSEAETDFMLDVARKTAFIAGVVAWTDFAARDAPERIARRAEDPLVKGFRPMLQDIADDRWMLGNALAPSFCALIAAGLRFDALVMPRHLPHLIRLAERYPDLPIVVDHGAKPAIATWRPDDAAFAAWANGLAALGSLGCFAKLSGLLTEARPDGAGGDLRPYADVLFEVFGPDRLIWGSDWPVVNLAGGYDAWREVSLVLAGSLGSAERSLLFGGAAKSFYGLCEIPDPTSAPL